MISPATNALCGLEIASGIRMFMVVDIAFGTLRTIIALSGLSDLSYVPTSGVYALAWFISSVNAGILSFMCGVLAAFGLQRNSWRLLCRFWMLKSTQVFLAVAGGTMILANLDEVASEVMENYIVQQNEDSGHSGFPPPVIDRKTLFPYFREVVYVSSILSVSIWSVFGLYAAYLGYSQSFWLKNGTDPSETLLRVSIAPVPDEGSDYRLFNVATELQGQSTSIPVALCFSMSYQFTLHIMCPFFATLIEI